MVDLRKLNISTEELSKAINPFHINVCEIDRDRLIEAYPSLVVENMMSEFNQQTNKYIAKQLIAFDIDKDVLIKQTQEIQRLNNKIANMKDMTRKMLKEAYNKAIDDFVNKINESNQGHWRPTRYEHGEVVSETMSYDIGTIRLIAKQLKAGGVDG